MKAVMLLFVALLPIACSNPSDIPPTVVESKPTTNKTANAVTDARTLLVRFKPEADRASIHKKLGANVERQFSSVEGLEQVRLPEGVSVQEALNYYNQHPDVRYAEAEQRYEAQ